MKTPDCICLVNTYVYLYSIPYTHGETSARHNPLLLFARFRVNIQYTYNLVVTGTSFLDADSALNDDKKNVPKTTVTPYARLLRQSPMTSTIAAGRYKSNHRVLGNIVNALINLQKYTVSRIFSL